MKKLFLVIPLLWLLSCSGNNEKPENLMTKEQMVDFLIDLHIIEARLNAARIPNDSIKLFFRDIEDSLFRKHEITDSIYYQSYEYYLENIKEMENIYEAVVDSLSIRERMMK